jgi:hypothetical protein
LPLCRSRAEGCCRMVRGCENASARHAAIPSPLRADSPALSRVRVGGGDVARLESCGFFVLAVLALAGMPLDKLAATSPRSLPVVRFSAVLESQPNVCPLRNVRKTHASPLGSDWTLLYKIRPPLFEKSGQKGRGFANVRTLKALFCLPSRWARSRRKSRGFRSSRGHARPSRTPRPEIKRIKFSNGAGCPLASRGLPFLKCPFCALAHAACQGSRRQEARDSCQLGHAFRLLCKIVSSTIGMNCRPLHFLSSARCLAPNARIAKRASAFLNQLAAKTLNVPNAAR